MPSPNGKRLLLISRDGPDGNKLVDLLKSMTHYHVTSVSGDLDATQALAASSFDAVVFEADDTSSTSGAPFEALRQTQPNVPLIVVAEHRDDDLSKAIIEGGAEEYLAKDSLSGEEIVQHIEFSICRFEEQRMRDVTPESRGAEEDASLDRLKRRSGMKVICKESRLVQLKRKGLFEHYWLTKLILRLR